MFMRIINNHFTKVHGVYRIVLCLNILQNLYFKLFFMKYKLNNYLAERVY